MIKAIQLFITAAILLTTIQPAPAEVLGTYGATYKIAEKDAIADIKEHAKKVNWKEVFSKKAMDRKVKEYKPAGLPNIPDATENRTFLRDMTYTLPTEIPDGKGGIAYPQGYTFNPLEYLTLNKIIVFINGSDKKQVRWFEKSPYLKDIKTMLIITDGSYYELIKRLKRPVYQAVRHICERFGIEHVPSVAVQKGKYMEISEFVPVVVEKAAKEKK